MKAIRDEYGALLGLVALVGVLIYGLRWAQRKDVKHASEMTEVAARLGLAPAGEAAKTLEGLLEGMDCVSVGDNRTIKNTFSARVDGIRYWICDVQGHTYCAGEYGGGASCGVRTLVIAESSDWNLPAVRVRRKHRLTGVFPLKRVTLTDQPLLEKQVVVEAEDASGARKLLPGDLGTYLANHADHGLETRGRALVRFPTASFLTDASATPEAVTTLFAELRDCARLIKAHS